MTHSSRGRKVWSRLAAYVKGHVAGPEEECEVADADTVQTTNHSHQDEVSADPGEGVNVSDQGGGAPIEGRAESPDPTKGGSPHPPPEKGSSEEPVSTSGTSSSEESTESSDGKKAPIMPEEPADSAPQELPPIKCCFCGRDIT